MTELTQKHILEHIKQLAERLIEVKQQLDRIENVVKGGAGARK